MKYLLLLPGLLLLNCSSAKIATYNVSANDVADIDLILRKNKNFLIHFRVFDEQPPKTYTFAGHWNEKGDNLQLVFDLDKEGLPDLKALFDPLLDNSKSVKIIDKKTVEFNKTAKRIKIWGLECEKAKSK